MGTDWSPVGQIYFFTLHSTNPQFDIMDLKSIEDWYVEKQFKSVPNVVDVSSLGGITREYQVRLDPNKLISYGLSIAQVEQQLTNNNVNAGGSFIEAGLQQVNVRAVGLMKTVTDIGKTVIVTKTGTPVRIRDIATVTQGPKIRLGRNGKAIHKVNGAILDNDDVIEGIVLLRKGAESDSTLDAIHEKVKELNGTADRPGLLPPGVKIVPFHRSQRPGPFHYPHRVAQPDGRNHSCRHHPVCVSWEYSRRIDRLHDNSFRPSLCVDVPEVERHSCESSFARRAGFWNGRRRGCCHGRKYPAPSWTEGWRGEAATPADRGSRA